MLNDVFQKSYADYRSMNLFGQILDDFDDWLIQHGYAYQTRKVYLTRCNAIQKYFWARKKRYLSVLTTADFHACWLFYLRHPSGVAVVVSCLRQFLLSRELLIVSVSPPSMFSDVVNAYGRHLTQEKGLVKKTVQRHCVIASELLLSCVKNDGGTFSVTDLSRQHVEQFTTGVAPRFSRGTLQHVVAQVRSFLRFLAMRGEVPASLASQIDTPRIYRLEKLPRTVAWATVLAFVESIDRTRTSGLRDYAMLLLIATYGMRCCDVAGLKLSDVDWRAGQINLIQSKTNHPLTLPLTDPVAEALAAYLRHGRPRSSCREIFLTAKAPIVPMKGNSVGSAYRVQAERTELDIPKQNVHAFRHSFAVHLLRQGVAPKIIGDVLGHRSTESTGTYLRLQIDDLRDVALPLPLCLKGGSHDETR